MPSRRREKNTWSARTGRSEESLPGCFASMSDSGFPVSGSLSIAELALNDGDTTKTFRATDNEGADSSTSATITVLSNSPPEVTINGGDRIVEDSDGVSEELVNTVSGTVSDLDGVIREMKWLVSWGCHIRWAIGNKFAQRWGHRRHIDGDGQSRGKC